jgi:FixJ family two-component response regulator
MPGITGLELSEKCLQLCPDLPIILMTGFSEQVNKNKAQATGIRGFIQKPLGTKKLLNHIHQLIRKE